MSLDKEKQLQEIAKQFLQQYYSATMQNRAQLINFYTNNSIITAGGSTYRGLKEIAERIESFGFQNIQYKVISQDVQEGPINGSMLIFVTGFLQMDNDDQLRFSQVFNVCPNGSGGMYVHNDVFTVVN